MCEFKELLGKTLVSVQNRDGEEIIFVTNEDEEYKLYHNQDCCESVYVEEVIGDLNDLVGVPLLMVEESSNDDYEKDPDRSYDDEILWTFYRLRTIKGDVTIRWLGESNGYYGVEVSFCKM